MRHARARDGFPLPLSPAQESPLRRLRRATGTIEPSCYDLLASEARIAVFVAIAKGDIPQEAWFHLGRGHTLFRGERILLSWTGTMFEYLMPALWMRHYPDTIMEQSIRAAVRSPARIRQRAKACRGESRNRLASGRMRASTVRAIRNPGLSLKPRPPSLSLVSPVLLVPGAGGEPPRGREEPSADGGIRLVRPLRLLRGGGLYAARAEAR